MDEGGGFADEVNRLLTDQEYWESTRLKLKEAFTASYSKERFSSFCAEIF